MIFFEALASGGGSDWYYTVLMKAPLGAEITLDDGDEEVTATGAGTDTLIGIPVHNPSSAYTLSVEMDGLTAPTQTVNTPTTSGGISTVITVNFAEINILFDDNFRSQTLSITDGTHSSSITMPASGNNLTVHVPYTGDWTLEATDPVSGDTFNSSPNPVPITSLTQSINVGLYVIPDGETVTPTDDIETWLLCADIKDTGYTTLEEVLNDEEVLIKVLTDENATQYLKRSKTFINTGLVPTLSADNGKIYTAGQSFSSGYEAWKVFDGDSSTRALLSSANTTAYIGYIFDDSIRIGKVVVSTDVNISSEYSIECSDTGTDWNQCSNTVLSSSDTDNITLNINSGTGEHRYWRMKKVSSSSTSGVCKDLQFFPWSEGITENELAMQAIGSYDVAANILLSDSDWESALGSSDYGTDVFNTKVPKMTSNSAPSGTASCSSYWNNNDDFNAYKAFHLDPLTSNADPRGWLPAASQSNQWVQYDFGESKEVSIWALSTYYGSGDKTFTLTASNDSSFSSPVTLGTITAKADNYSTIHSLHVGDGTPYRYYRVTISGTTDSAAQGIRCQFYGREVGGVQDWLKAAGLTKPYTTLQEVLNDPNTLATLVTNHDAVDYLVTAKALIDDICADETAMRYIGKRNYCADTLLADEDWATAIVNSPYSSSVINSSTPNMTGPSAPSGYAATASSVSSGEEAWKAFDGSTSTDWHAGSQGQAWLQIELPEKRKLLSYDLVPHYQAYSFVKDYKILGSDDPTFATYDVLKDTSIPYNSATVYNDPVDDMSTAYKYFRLLCVTTYYTSDWRSVNEWKLYFRTDVDESKIDIYAAAGATVSRVKSDGTSEVIDTVDNTGHKQIDKSAISNGDYIITTNVAKNPCDLTSDYTKRVVVDNDTVELMAMPNNSLYWYGNDVDNLHTYCSNTGTGGSGVNKRANDIAATASNGVTCVIRTNNTKDISKFERLAFLITQGGYNSSYPSTFKYGVGTAEDNDTFSLNNTSNAFFDLSLKELDIKSILSGSIKLWLKHNTSNYGTCLLNGTWFDRLTTPTYLSAANDILYILDGARQIPIATTNAAGKSYDLMLPPGTYDIYSSVAKDPDDLTSPYHKTVTITPYTRTVKVMPDGNVLYWYGYIGEGYEETTTANGWSPYPGDTVNANITKQLNYLDMNNASTSKQEGGISYNRKTDGKCNSHRIVTGVTAYQGNYGIFEGMYGKDFNGSDWEIIPLKYVNASSMAKYSILNHDSGVYPVLTTISGMRLHCHAFWLTMPSSVSNFFSAANDTVYYTENGVDIVVAETDEFGGAKVDFSQIPTGVTLKSTIADDPDSLATTPSKFSKVFNGPNADGKFYLMPEDGDKMLYWYGWMCDGLELMSTANGWSDPSNTYSNTTTFEANSIQMSAETSKYTGCATKNTVKASNIYAICEGITGLSNIYGYLIFVGDKGQISQLISDRTNMSCKSNSLQLLSGSTSPAVDGYLGVKTAYGRSMKAYAFWYED